MPKLVVPKVKPNAVHFPRLQSKMLDVDLLNVDPSYQRPEKKGTINNIFKSLDVVGFGKIHVARRPNDTYWVVDGQQRFVAAKKLGLKQIPCLVFESTGAVYEAGVFGLINDKRRNTTRLESFKAALKHKEPEARTISQIVEELGFTIGNRGGTGSWQMIGAVSALQSVYRRGAKPLLSDVLSILKEAWEGDKIAVQALPIWGTAYFLQKIKCPNFDRNRLVKMMRTETPDRLIRASKGFVSLSGGMGRVKAFALGLAQVYNKGLRSVGSRVKIGDDEDGFEFDAEPEPPIVPPATNGAAPA